MSSPAIAAERVLELCGRTLSPERVGLFPARDGLPATPEAAPRTVEELVELVHLARAERWKVLPIGNGTKLGWLRAPARVDLLLTSRELRGITAYEPADGTLTALAGTPWAELEAATRARHHLSPELPDADRATLGGALGAGASGFDRLRHGPLRHQILGSTALHADGSRVRSGGRVVKNVTGYDMHRLWCGSEGSLCFLLEATLRLYPSPAETAVLQASCADVAEGLAQSHALLRAGVQPLAVVLRATDGEPGAEIAAVLAGRPDAVDHEAARVRELLGTGESLRGEPARRARAELRELERAEGRWAPLVLAGRPSRLGRTLAELEAATAALGLRKRLTLHPLLAQVSVEFPGTELHDERLVRLAGLLAGAPLTARWRGLGAHQPPARTSQVPAELMRRIKRSLDPEGLFAGGPAQA